MTNATRAICQAWTRLLEVEVGPGDDFFDLGGYSLLVPTAVDMVGDAGVRITVTDILDHRTPRAIAEFIGDRKGREPTGVPSFDDVWSRRRADGDRTARLVPLAEGTGRPIFCFHWDVGNIAFLGHRVDSFRAGRPVWGTESIGLTDHATPATELGEAADGYLRAIRDMQPNGPYTFFGVCDGGRLAVDIAARIEQATGEAATVVMLNTAAPGVNGMNPNLGLRELYDFRLGILRLYFDIPDLAAEPQRLGELLLENEWIDPGTSLPDVYWRQLIWATEQYSHARHRFQHHGGRTLLVESAEVAVAKGWRPALRNLDVRAVATSGTRLMLDDPATVAILREEFGRVR